MIRIDESHIATELNRLAAAVVPDDAFAEPRGSRSPEAWSDISLDRSMSGELTLLVGSPARRDVRPHRTRMIALVLASVVAVAGFGALAMLDRNGASRPAEIPIDTTSPAPRFDPGVQWRDGADMIVFVSADATPASIDAIRSALDSFAAIDGDRVTYLDSDQSMAEARLLFADDPDSLALLNADNLPTMFRVWARPGHEAGIASLKSTILNDLPDVNSVRLATQVTAERLIAATPIDDDTAAIVFVDPDASRLEIDSIRDAALEFVDSDHLAYLDVDLSMASAQEVFASDPANLSALNTHNIPTRFVLSGSIAPDQSLEHYYTTKLTNLLLNLPGVLHVKVPDEPATPPADTIAVLVGS